jgi:hypothetical protein
MNKWKEFLMQVVKAFGELIGSILAIPSIILIPLFIPLMVLGVMVAVILLFALAIPCGILASPILLYVWASEKINDRRTRNANRKKKISKGDL